MNNTQAFIPYVQSHQDVYMWMHNMYLGMMHKKCEMEVEAMKRKKRRNPGHSKGPVAKKSHASS